MSDRTQRDIEIAGELRGIAEGTARWTAFGRLREIANELDPPPKPLPDVYGWHPNVSARGEGYRPGAVRFNPAGSDWHWIVITARGSAEYLSDEWVEVTS